MATNMGLLCRMAVSTNAILPIFVTLFIDLELKSVMVYGHEAHVQERDKCPLACQCRVLRLHNVTGWKVDCTAKNYWNTVPPLPRNIIYLKMHYAILRNGSFTKVAGKTLSTLDIAKNKFSSIESRALRNLDKLKKLLLTQNKLVNIPNGTFSDIPNLTILTLNNNRFKVMPINNICLLKKLRMFEIVENKLTMAKFDECFTMLKNLFHVDLSGNPFKKLARRDFYGLRRSSVKELYLGHLGLTALEKNIFQYVPKLAVLSLKLNKLTSFPPDISQHTPGIKVLMLLGNKFNTIIPKFNKIIQKRSE